MGMYSFTDGDTGFKVDLFPLRPGDAVQQAAFTKRVAVEILEGLTAYVYTSDDLLVQKLRWYAATNSERQFRDCLNLLITDRRRSKPLIALEYIDDWAGKLGPDVVDAWSRLKEAAKAIGTQLGDSTKD